MMLHAETGLTHQDYRHAICVSVNHRLQQRPGHNLIHVGQDLIRTGPPPANKMGNLADVATERTGMSAKQAVV